MHDIINGKRVDLTPEQIAEREAEIAVIIAEQQVIELKNLKEAQKAQLRTEKLDSMLVLEFAEIDAAATEADVKKVKLK